MQGVKDTTRTATPRGRGVYNQTACPDDRASCWFVISWFYAARLANEIAVPERVMACRR
jgi:hypothetical protein